jgi:hypothetical protein
MFGRMEVPRQLLVYKEKIHKHDICLVEEGKVKDIVLAADLEGKAVPGYPVATGFSPPRGGGAILPAFCY